MQLKIIKNADVKTKEVIDHTYAALVAAYIYLI